MTEIKRRDLLIGAGAVAAAGGATAAVAASGGGSSKALAIDLSKGTPTLPLDRDHYSFPLASAWAPVARLASREASAKPLMITSPRFGSGVNFVCE